MILLSAIVRNRVRSVLERTYCLYARVYRHFDKLRDRQRPVTVPSADPVAARRALGELQGRVPLAARSVSHRVRSEFERTENYFSVIYTKGIWFTRRQNLLSILIGNRQMNIGEAQRLGNKTSYFRDVLQAFGAFKNGTHPISQGEV